MCRRLSSLAARRARRCSSSAGLLMDVCVWVCGWVLCLALLPCVVPAGSASPAAESNRVGDQYCVATLIHQRGSRLHLLIGCAGWCADVVLCVSASRGGIIVYHAWMDRCLSRPATGRGMLVCRAHVVRRVPRVGGESCGRWRCRRSEVRFERTSVCTVVHETPPNTRLARVVPTATSATPHAACSRMV
jgi:hypothetical protein